MATAKKGPKKGPKKASSAKKISRPGKKAGKKRRTPRVMPFAAAFCAECKQRYPKTPPARGGLFHEVWCSKYPKPVEKNATAMLEEAFAEFEREYRVEIDAICDDIANEIMVGRIDDRSVFEEKIYELLDTHVYTLSFEDALAVLRVSDHDAEGIDNLGAGLVTDGAVNYGLLVYYAMQADVRERLDRRGITNNGEPAFPPGESDDEEEGESNAENGAGSGAGASDRAGAGSGTGATAGAVGGPAIVDGVVGRYISRRELEVDAGAGSAGAGGGDPAAGSAGPTAGPADGAGDA